MYPSRSNFRVGDPGAGWFRRAGGQICATQGRAAVYRAQKTLNARATAGLAPDGEPGTATLTALASWADRLELDYPGRGFSAIRDVIRGDLGARRISFATWKFLLWVAYASPTESLDAIVLPPDALLPGWASTADDYGFDADGGGGGAFCWQEGAVPPTLPTLAMLRDQAGRSSTGGGSSSRTSTGGGGGGSNPLAPNATPGGAQASFWSKWSTGQKTLAVAAAGAAVVAAAVFATPRRRRRRKR